MHKLSRHLLQGGRFALGFFSGILAALAALLYFDLSGTKLGLSHETYYTLLGALIAAIVGVSGQLLTIAANEKLEMEKTAIAERDDLLKALQKTLTIYNLFIQVKELGESTSPKDNLVIGAHFIMKPIFGANWISEFTDHELLVALKIGDVSLSTKLNELNGMVANYLRLHPIYTEQFNALTDPTREGVRFDSSTGWFHGEVEIRSSDVFRLMDVQKHLVATAYRAISHSDYIIGSIQNHLEKRNSYEIKFVRSISDAEMAQIREGLED